MGLVPATCCRDQSQGLVPSCVPTFKERFIAASSKSYNESCGHENILNHYSTVLLKKLERTHASSTISVNSTGFTEQGHF